MVGYFTNRVGYLTESVSGFSSLLDDRITSIELHQLELSEAIGEFHGIVEYFESANAEDSALAAFQSKLNVAISKIEALEELLDIEPRQIISLIRLQDDVEKMKLGYGEVADRTLREIDRVYNIVWTFIGALFVSMILMVLGNVLQRREDR